jgi:hypothetical protein
MTEFSACACMGPMYNEPHCYCQMMRLGLPLNEAARKVEKDRLLAGLEALFGEVSKAGKMS